MESDTRVRLVEQELAYTQTALKNLGERVGKLETRYTDLLVAFSILKTQVAMYAGIGAVAGGIIVALTQQFLVKVIAP